MKKLLNLEDIKLLSKTEQKFIKGGWPSNKEECENCNGEWGGVNGSETFGLCALSHDSPCL